ncbi:hypothetical protein BS47DRAFT_1352432 [Hydnum rufescens UP504]|uniref:Uncharacterized protein n=1 Tax=Hydnum rufescens UP504 TaxID=1448309 RepID=A0A9P6DPW6_9AGAM|nr:hypothetical protein BS47DRAFT_1352432 [Hydnum rufescens UP504]
MVRVLCQGRQLPDLAMGTFASTELGLNAKCMSLLLRVLFTFWVIYIGSKYSIQFSGLSLIGAFHSANADTARQSRADQP